MSGVLFKSIYLLSISTDFNKPLYCVFNILPEEKGKLSNIVYNIVIVLPSQKDKDAKILIDEFSAKNLVKLSKDIPEMQNQEYYSSCSVAITSSVLVNNAITFYQVHLESENSSPSKAIPTWTLPAEEQLNVVTPASSIMEANQNLNSNNVNPNISFSNNINQLPDNILNPVPDFNNNASLPNPQAEILTAVNNDPNLSEATGISTIQPNLGKQKKAGFANNKYIIIGTVCILLSIAVVIVAYILIKNK